jgi:hypothetical protein
VKHWHIITSSGSRDVIGAYRYDNHAKSIVDYVDIVYTLFDAMLEEGDRATYLNNMMNLAENTEGYHIYTRSKKLTISWTDCNDDPCAFAVYN